jgi:hypothetical protein
MSSALSERSSVRLTDVAALIGALGHLVSEKSYVIPFGAYAKQVTLGRYASVFDNMRKIQTAMVGHSTEAYKAFDLLTDAKLFVDRIILLSDMQCYGSLYTLDSGHLSAYKRKVNPNVFLHSVDLVGYGTAQFDSKTNVNLMSGFSDKIYNMIATAEGLTDVGSESQPLPSIEQVRQNW